MGYSDHHACDSMGTPDIISHHRNKRKITYFLQASPNPFDDIINLSAFVPMSGTYEITVVNLSGHTMWRESAYTSGSNLSVEVYIGDLPSGMYILRLENYGHREVTRIIKN
jgi:hypothetical protein